MSAIPDLPEAFAALPLDRLEEFEKSSGRGFGELIDEFQRGTWSISTMRSLVRLIDPEAKIETMGDLVEAAAALNPKASEPSSG